MSDDHGMYGGSIPLDRIMKLKELAVGTRICITQVSYAPSRPDRKFTIEGKYLGCETSDTGAPWAHSKSGHYQMFRVRIEKDNGEISVMNIDGRTEVKITGGVA